MSTCCKHRQPLTLSLSLFFLSPSFSLSLSSCSVKPFFLSFHVLEARLKFLFFLNYCSVSSTAFFTSQVINYPAPLTLFPHAHRSAYFPTFFFFLSFSLSLCLFIPYSLLLQLVKYSSRKFVYNFNHSLGRSKKSNSLYLRITFNPISDSNFY